MITKTPGELFPNGQTLHEGIIQAVENGYAFVPNGIADWACDALEAEAKGFVLEPEASVTTPIHSGTPRQITQQFEKVDLPVSSPEIPVATFIARALHTRIAALRYRYPPLKHWYATDAGYQLYRNPDDHISKHRDKNADELLGVTITALGAASIGIHETLGDPNDYTNTRQTDECLAERGTVMFLRARGFGGDERVIHDVSGPIGGPRLVLNLRQRP